MKVSIVGKATGWQYANRANCKPGEVWGLNTHCLMRNYDRVFDIHDMSKYPRDEALRKRYHKHINENNIPVYTIRTFPDIPTSIQFPLEDMPFLYFMTSIDYMIAYAIHLGATTIQLFGVKILRGLSHEHARPCIEFWLGYAVAHGIEVNIYPPSDIFKLNGPGYPNGYLYGFGLKVHDYEREEKTRPRRLVVPQTRPKAPASDCH